MMRQVGLEGLPSSIHWKKFLRWQFAEVCEAANRPKQYSRFVLSNAFGLASAPVSLKPSRPQLLPGAQNESTAISESLARHCLQSLSARSLGMAERLIPNSELCALCQSGRAKVAAVGCRARHPLINDRRCAAIDADDSAIGPPSSQHCQSSWPRLSAS